MKIVERALADDGPADARRAGRAHRRQGIRTEGQATPHLLGLAALRGIAVLGPLRDDGAHAFALARDWLGARRPALEGAERDAALAELARRYLAAHGPAAPADLAAGAASRCATPAPAERDRRRARPARRRPRRPRPREPAPDAIPARLLPAFDPYLLGWKDRSFAVPARHAKRVHPGGGMLRATATVDGLAVGTWSARGRQVALELFGRVGVAARGALQADADDVARFVQGS